MSNSRKFSQAELALKLLGPTKLSIGDDCRWTGPNPSTRIIHDPWDFVICWHDLDLDNMWWAHSHIFTPTVFSTLSVEEGLSNNRKLVRECFRPIMNVDNFPILKCFVRESC